MLRTGLVGPMRAIKGLDSMSEFRASRFTLFTPHRHGAYRKTFNACTRRQDSGRQPHPFHRRRGDTRGALRRPLCYLHVVVLWLRGLWLLWPFLLLHSPRRRGKFPVLFIAFDN